MKKSKKLADKACKKYAECVDAMVLAIASSVDELGGSMDFDVFENGIIVKRKVVKNNNGQYFLCDEEGNELKRLDAIGAEYLYDLCIDL